MGDIYLPVEIITHILRYLKVSDRLNAGLCCKLWHSVSLQTIFWSDVSLHIFNSVNAAYFTLKDTKKPIQHIILEDIDITESFQFIETFFKHIGPNLSSFEIRSTNLSENSLQRILLNCCNLKCLKIVNCRDFFLSGQIFWKNENFDVMKANMPHISELYLNDNLSYLTDILFEQLVSVVAQLKILCFAGTSISFHPGIYHRYYPRGSQEEKASEFVLTYKRILLYIKNHSATIKSLDFSRTNFNDEASHALSKVEGLYLDSLFLNGTDVGSTGLSAICFSHQMLIRLDLSACVRITDSALIILGSCLPRLQFLSLRNCRSLTDKGISSLNLLKALRHVNVQGLSNITADGLECGLLSQPNQLRRINLSATCIQAKTISQIALLSHQLTFLNLTSCAAVTDTSLCIIWDLLNQLQYLILDWCINISSAGFMGSISDGLKFLETRKDWTPSGICKLRGLLYLSIAGCNQITDQAIGALYLKELRYINVANCNSITNAGVLSMARNTSLEVLILRQCPLITDECIVPLANSLVRLRLLDVQGCKKLSDVTKTFIERYNTHPSYMESIRSW